MIQNSSKIPRVEQTMSEGKEVSLGLLKCTPSTSPIEYCDIKNPQGLLNKIKEFNEKAEDKKLNER